MPQDHSQTPIPFGQPQPANSVEIVAHARKLHMYTLTDPELNSLQESGLSATIDLSLFSLCFGICVALVITLSTVEIDNQKTYAAYVASSTVTGLFSLWFGIRALVAMKNAKTKLAELKQSA